MSEVKNAIITGTMLGNEDHGIFTCFLFLDGDGWGVGFGGYGLDGWDEEQQKSIAKSGVGLEFIKAILETVGVEKWEDLKGKHIRADLEGGWGKCLRIGHIMKDKWFNPKEFFEKEKAKLDGE